MHIVMKLIPLAFVAFCMAAAAQNLAKLHHTADGFKNNYIGTVNKSFSELFRWQIERRAAGLPKPPEAPVAVNAPDLAFIAAYKTNFVSNPAQPPAVTWIGHASVLVQAGGLNVLTDPMLSHRASPVQLIGPVREQPPGLALADLPPIDVVVISHNHYDHLDMPSVLAVAQRSQAAGIRTLFMVPLGMKAWFVNLGLDHTIEFDWWEQFTLAGVRFNFTPTQHWSARGVGDRSQTLWGGWAVHAPDLHWYFAGDTGYSKDFTDTRERMYGGSAANPDAGFDLALLPIGAYQPRWFLSEQHVDPAEAVQIHRELNAKTSIGIHWGTFLLSDESADQPPKDLTIAAQGLAPGAFTVMAIGATRQLPRRSP